MKKYLGKNFLKVQHLKTAYASMVETNCIQLHNKKIKTTYRTDIL